MNLTAVIEVTEKCNLGCNFCLRPSFEAPVMKEVILENVIKHIINYSDKGADFIWHGGEPLIAGLNFFKNIVEIQKKYNTNNLIIKNNVQTNATKLNKDFIEFFQKEKFEIATSIQGTKQTHDITRLTLGGKGTYDKVIYKISLLETKPASIVALTTEILGKEEEIYFTTKKHVRGMKVLEYFPGGLNPSKSGLKVILGDRIEPLMPTAEEYGKSMISFYEVWKNDPNPIDLKPITEIIRSLVIGKSSGCLYSQEACNNSVIGIKSSGEFYTCIRGSPDKEFSIGYVDKEPLKEYKEKAEGQKNRRILQLLGESCKNCNYWNYCNGGCPLESWKLYRDLDHKTEYCEGRKILFEYILKDLKVQNEV